MSDQLSTDKTADETTGETTGESGDGSTDPEARMRAYWDREVAAGRMPTGADLVRAALPAKVSPATGRRRRASWEAELVGTGAGDGRDAASA